MSKKKRILKDAKKEKLAEKKEVIKAVKKAKEIVKSGVVNKSATDFSSLDFSCIQKNSEGHPWNLKIASWNIAGVRAWQKKDGMKYFDFEKPDILCVQEIKISPNKLDASITDVPGYTSYWCLGGTDGYAGVGIYSKIKPIYIKNGIGDGTHDKEGRVITAEFENFFLVNAYVPNAGRGLVRLKERTEWDQLFREYLKRLDQTKPVVLCGDLNVSHKEIDLTNPKTNKNNAGFTQIERDGFSTLLSEGFVDTYRQLYPDKTGVYTFWTYMMNARKKNVGWRLDYFVISERFLPALCDHVVRSEVYGSDHCPIVLLLHT
ncbi:DNA repair nuclease APEX1-like isoform X2 [Artemia franciscana]